jgi:hypothetical protein
VQHVEKKDTIMTIKLIRLLLLLLTLASFKGDSYIIPDDYLVSNAMFEKFRSEINIEGVFSFDKAWFKNQELGEVLIFYLYTDYFRLAIFHCKSDFFFPDFIKQVELHRKTGMSTFDFVDEKEKQEGLKKFYENSEEIDISYFRTKQGIRLGISRSDAIRKYGIPGSDTSMNNLRILKWDFQGEYAIEEFGEKPKGRIAQDSFGYHVIMYFKMEKLVAMILKNDIP